MTNPYEEGSINPGAQIALGLVFAVFLSALIWSLVHYL